MAGRPCSICSLPSEQRARIDQALADGESLSAIARAHGVTRDALRRHKSAGHISQGAQEPLPAGENNVLAASTKTGALRSVLAQAQAFTRAAAERKDFRGALLGTKTMLEILKGTPDEPVAGEAPKLIIITQTKHPDGTVEEHEHASEFPTPLEQLDSDNQVN